MGEEWGTGKKDAYEHPIHLAAFRADKALKLL
jgi:hypothetical protein